MSYAGERSTFKLLVGRAGPFRVFSVEMLTVTHAVLVGMGVLMNCLFRWQRVRRLSSSSAAAVTATFDPPPVRRHYPLGIPILDVGLMAALDTIHLVLSFVGGVHVPPTLTVILVQFTLPLTAFLTQFVHPDGMFNVRKYRRDNNGDTGGNTTTESTSSSSPSCHDNPANHPNDDDDNGTGGGGGGGGGGSIWCNRCCCRRQASSSSSSSRSRTAAAGTPLKGFGGLSAEHVVGSLVITLAVLLALLPALYCTMDPDFFVYAEQIPVRTAYNTLLYVSSCIPAAASQLYKEHVFCLYKQPVNMSNLNIVLSVFQFAFALVLSPLAYTMQGFGTINRGVNWMTLYPAASLGENFVDGIKCFFGFLSTDDQCHKYPEDADCPFALGLVILHAVSVAAVGVAVDMIVNAGATKVMYRGVSAGIIVAVFCMYQYDMHIPDFNYGPAIDALTLACLIILVVGSEIYHRTTLQSSTFDTVYPEMNQDFD